MNKKRKKSEKYQNIRTTWYGILGISIFFCQIMIIPAIIVIAVYSKKIKNAKKKEKEAAEKRKERERKINGYYEYIRKTYPYAFKIKVELKGLKAWYVYQKIPESEFAKIEIEKNWRER